MWPNDRWHKIFSPLPSHTPPEPSQVATYRNVGVYLAIRTACERVGLLDAIRDVLPGYQDLLLALVTYLIDEPQATGCLFDGWCHHNYCGFPSPVSDAAVADLFRDLIESGVGPDGLTGRFCEAYQANVFEGKGRALVLEHRQGDQCGEYGSTQELCQALLVDERTSIPLTVADYCGPILDVTETRATMGSIHALGVESLLFVVGGAYATDERAEEFAESGYEFAAEVPRSHDLYRYAMAEKSEEVRLEACYLYREDCYATVTEAHDCLGGTFDVHLFFDRTRAKSDVDAIHEEGMALLDLANKHVDHTEKLRDAFAPCVPITQTLRDPRASKNFNAALNASYYQPQVDNAGYFSLVASPGHTSQEILRAYRIHQRVGEHFARYNKSLDSFVSDPRTHAAKTLIAFIALVATESILWYIRDLSENHRDIALVLAKIRKLQCLKDDHGTGRLATRLTSHQKEIFSCLGLDEHDIAEMVAQLSL